MSTPCLVRLPSCHLAARLYSMRKVGYRLRSSGARGRINCSLWRSTSEYKPPGRPVARTWLAPPPLEGVGANPRFDGVKFGLWQALQVDADDDAL